MVGLVIRCVDDSDIPGCSLLYHRRIPRRDPQLRRDVDDNNSL